MKIKTTDLSFSYGDRTILNSLDIAIPPNCITAITGASGAGKSTFLTLLNRLWDSGSGNRVCGTVKMLLENEIIDIYSRKTDVSYLRRKVGMVFQAPDPLPFSIFKNVSFPLKLAGIRGKAHIEQRVKAALVKSGLWDEVCDRLTEDARSLSGGQQQRLCIARALISEPEVLLLDEPTSSLDPDSEAVIEGLISELKKECTIIIVSHSKEQVQRVADRVFNLSEGKLS